MTAGADKAPLVGQDLGKYRLERLLGAGNMATVYLARDPFMDRPVAIKVARVVGEAESDDDRLARRLFFNEARTAGLLRHPNIVSIHDAARDGQYSYIVMEYVAGGRTLAEYTQPDALLPVERVADILHQLALALDYAHRRGVVHRDVKPRNILIGESLEVKLADFGAAVSARAPGDGAQALVGSPLYMSPEQIRFEAPTGQSDLFSLGIVAYELLTGHHPFEAGNLDAIGYRIQHTRPQPLAALRDDAPAILQRILDKALARNPRFRYRTGADLAGDLLLVYEFLRPHAAAISQREKFARLRGLTVFAGLDDVELWELVHTGEWLVVAAGDVLVDAGAAELCCCVMVEGRARIELQGVALVEMGPGECFGESGGAVERGRSTRVVAASSLIVLRVRGSVAARLSVATQLKFQQNFLRALVGRLEATKPDASGGQRDDAAP